MNNHPQISELYKIYQLETQPFRKVHRLIDLFESIIKTHTVVIMSSYVNHNKLSDTAKGLLAQGLRTPSLGTWQLFSRELFKELESDSYKWPLASFATEFIALDKSLNAEKTNVISFRNNYAHGATPTDSQCEADIEQFEPYLLRLLASKWLSDSAIKIVDHKLVLQSQQSEISLHPLLLYRPEASEHSIAFFNDIKNDKIGLLNYPLSKHYREKEFLEEFHHYLPLNEWKKSGNTDFNQRIEELTETFKGRVLERQQLLEFITTQTKGYCSIQGNPGIGKSALIAQFFKDIRTNKTQTKSIKVVEYFIRRGTQQAQVDYLLNYLIKRTDEHFPKGREIRAEGKMLFDLQNQLFAKWRLWGEHGEGNKLLFLIDGLDEGIENEVLKYLPRENFEHILIIYGSRPGGHKSIDELWGTLPVSYHKKIELTGLSKEDIRALIYEVADKYLIERDSTWIDAIQQRSEGNPLYLRLLCDALENGSMHVNNINALPKAIDEYYKAILLRYANDPDGDALLDGLFTFTAAKDYLTIAHLGYVNQLSPASLHRISSTLKEVLYENPLTESVLDYQLFHESFREYLVKHNSKEIQEATERLIVFCSTWRELSGTWEQRYALEHYAIHLAESKKANRIMQLVVLAEDTEYTTTQKHVLKQYNATQKLYRIVLDQANSTKDYDNQLKAALLLIDLNYEEQNDAHQIVPLVATGNPEDLDLALKRIESFGGSDRYGIQRRFMLYMLCLMELTLLESKNKPFRKQAIEKIILSFDEKIPSGTSMINWSNFFSSYIMVLMAIEWTKLELDFSAVFERTSSIDDGWIIKKGPYTNFQIEVFGKIGINTTNDYFNKNILNNSIQLVNSNQFEKVNQDNLINLTIKEIQNQIASAKLLTDNISKCRILADLSTSLFYSNEKEKAIELMDETILYTQDIGDEIEKYNVIDIISRELIKQGSIVKAFKCVSTIEVNYKYRVFRNVFNELAMQDNFESAFYYLQEFLKINKGIKNREKNQSISHISSKLAQNGLIEPALSYSKSINNKWKSITLATISTELFNKSNHDEAEFVLNDAIKYTENLDDIWFKNHAFSVISCEAAKQGKHELALEIFEKIDLTDSFIEWIINSLNSITFEVKNKNELEEVLFCIRNIKSKDDRIISLSAISSVLFKKGQLDKVFEIMQEINEFVLGEKGYRFYSVLAAISTELIKQSKKKESALIMKEVLEFTLDKNTDFNSHVIHDIVCELAIQEQWSLVEKIILKMSRLDRRQYCLSEIANKFYDNMCCDEALHQVLHFKNQEIQQEYLKGWATNVSVIDANSTLIAKALPFLLNDTESIEKILQKHALYEFVFNNASAEKISLLNNTLDIQWFLEIYNSLPKSPAEMRNSTNLDTWLHEIEDEDDQDQITLWAKQVAKGKITEEEFQAKIKAI